jgi:DnaA N-terminal domain
MKARPSQGSTLLARLCGPTTLGGRAGAAGVSQDRPGVGVPGPPLCTSRSEVHDRPDQDGRPCTSDSAPTADLKVRGLPSHEEDPVEEDSNDGSVDRPVARSAVDDDPAALAWQAALDELEGLVSRTVFETCFRGTAAVAWAEDTFTIAAPHRFAREWIDVRYRAEAVEALRRVLARVPELVPRLPGLVVEESSAPAIERPRGRGPPPR